MFYNYFFFYEKYTRIEITIKTNSIESPTSALEYEFL